MSKVSDYDLLLDKINRIIALIKLEECPKEVKVICRNCLNIFCVPLIILVMVQIACAQLDSTDIGDAVNKPGSTDIENGTYTIEGSGHDIWDIADGFRFVYTSATGDIEVKVHIISFVPAHKWSSAGIMLRQSIDADSANVAASVIGVDGAQLTWRSSKATETFAPADDPPNLWDGRDCWIKLIRESHKIHGYFSEDDVNWIDLESIEVEMTDPILVGLAVSSGQNTILVEAIFDDFSITQNGKGIFPEISVNLSAKLPVLWGELKVALAFAADS